MITDSKYLFEVAKNNHYAIPHANFIDSNSARVFVKTAEKRGLPILLAFAQSHSSILSLDEAAAIGKFYAEKS